MKPDREKHVQAAGAAGRPRHMKKCSGQKGAVQ